MERTFQKMLRKTCTFVYLLNMVQMYKMISMPDKELKYNQEFDNQIVRKKIIHTFVV